jgi:hypothetical protein
MLLGDDEYMVDVLTGKGESDVIQLAYALGAVIDKLYVGSSAAGTEETLNESPLDPQPRERTSLGRPWL